MWPFFKPALNAGRDPNKCLESCESIKLEKHLDCHKFNMSKLQWEILMSTWQWPLRGPGHQIHSRWWCPQTVAKSIGEVETNWRSWRPRTNQWISCKLKLEKIQCSGLTTHISNQIFLPKPRCAEKNIHVVCSPCSFGRNLSDLLVYLLGNEYTPHRKQICMHNGTERLGRKDSINVLTLTVTLSWPIHQKPLKIRLQQPLRTCSTMHWKTPKCTKFADTLPAIFAYYHASTCDLSNPTHLSDLSHEEINHGTFNIYIKFDCNQ